MVEKIERTYTIPLRREYLKVPRYRRTEKASRALRQFLAKHMKSEAVKIGQHLNEFLWMHGMKNPPPRVKVNVVRIEDGTVYAELFGKPLKVGKEEGKKEGKKEALEEKKEEATGLESAVEKHAGSGIKQEEKTNISNEVRNGLGNSVSKSKEEKEIIEERRTTNTRRKNY